MERSLEHALRRYQLPDAEQDPRGAPASLQP